MGIQKLKINFNKDKGLKLYIKADKATIEDLKAKIKKIC